MISVNITVTEKNNPSVRLDKVKSILEKKSLYVGITSKTDSRGGRFRSNASLAALQEAGGQMGRAPNVPSRAFLVPAMDGKALQNSMLAILKEAVKDSTYGISTNFWESAGKMAANGVKTYFTVGNTWERNAPYTIQKKGFDMPLIESGQLRSAVTYEVK